MNALDADDTARHACLRACVALNVVSARHERAATGVLTQFERFTRRHRLCRSIFVVDDKAEALLALVTLLTPLGVPIHAVTQDDSEALRAAMSQCGATVHIVETCSEAPRIWSRVRSAVAVIDLHLDRGNCGAEVAVDLGRGPDVILVTSDEAAETERFERAARLAQASAVVRTVTGSWGERLRDIVSAALDRTAPPDLG